MCAFAVLLSSLLGRGSGPFQEWYTVQGAGPETARQCIQLEARQEARQEESAREDQGEAGGRSHLREREANRRGRQELRVHGLHTHAHTLEEHTWTHATRRSHARTFTHTLARRRNKSCIAAYALRLLDTAQTYRQEEGESEWTGPEWLKGGSNSSEELLLDVLLFRQTKVMHASLAHALARW